MTRRTRVTGLIGAALSLTTSSASAELADDVSRLEANLASRAEVRILEPAILTQGMHQILPLEPEETRATSEGCTTVVVLGAPSTSFVVRFAQLQPPPPGYRPDRPEVSVGGGVQVVRCGRRRRRLRGLSVEMRSPRGVVQALVARAPRPLAPFDRVLDHRQAGTAAVAVKPGPKPDNPAIVDRGARLQLRYERQGATEIHRRLIPADDEGASYISFDLEPGCHRFHALGISAARGPGPGLDIDAELAWADSGTVAASDRSESADAALSTCTAAPRQGLLTVAGAVPGVPILVVYARWDLPAGLPAWWGPEPTAAVAAELWRHRIPALPSSPVYESLGVGGDTLLPVPLEPDACYVASVAILRGAAQQLQLSARTNTGHSRRTHAESSRGSAMLAFCAEGAKHALLRVTAVGSTVAWATALWQTGRTVLGRSELER